MTIDTMDTDVADTDYVTHEEWMQLNNIIQRIDSNVDAPSTKQEPSPVSVIYMPLPVPGISSNVYLAIVHTVWYVTTAIGRQYATNIKADL